MSYKQFGLVCASVYYTLKLTSGSVSDISACIAYKVTVYPNNKYKQIQIPLFSIKHNTMFLAYIGKYTYNENMKKDVHICVI